MNLRIPVRNERTEKREYGLESGFCNDHTKGRFTLNRSRRFSEVFTNEYRNIPGKTFKHFLEAATKAVSKNNTGSKKIAIPINSSERFHFVAFCL